MNINNLLIVVGLAALSSCSTAYQTAQMPDDLYYSPPTETEEYLAVQNNEDRYSPNDDLETYRNDRWMRMSIGSPYRMSLFNDYYWNDWGYGGLNSLGYGGFGYSPFSLSIGFNTWGYNYMNPWNNPWAGPMYWNGFYNPYAFNYNPHSYPYFGGGYGGYGGIIPHVNPPVYRVPTPRATVFNPNAYKSTNSSSRSYYNPRTGSYSNYNNTNSANSRSLRRTTNSSSNSYYNTRQNSNNNRTYTPAPQRAERTYTPAPSNPSSGSRSSGGNSGGGVRRPTRN